MYVSNSDPLPFDLFALKKIKTNIKISPYPDLQKWQDQLHFDRKIKVFLSIPTCLIGEPALLTVLTELG